MLQNSRIWQGLRQWDNKTGILTVGYLHKTGKFEKMEIGQESINGLAKPQMRWQRGEYWQKANFDKYGEWAKTIIKDLAKYSNEMTKRGMLIAGDFCDNDKFCKDGEFGRKLSKVWKKFTKR